MGLVRSSHGRECYHCYTVYKLKQVHRDIRTLETFCVFREYYCDPQGTGQVWTWLRPGNAHSGEHAEQRFLRAQGDWDGESPVLKIRRIGPRIGETRYIRKSPALLASVRIGQNGGATSAV
jgi:hypothetical protein